MQSSKPSITPEETDTALSEIRPRRRLRKVIFLFVILGFVEGTAWIVDSYVDCRRRLLGVYRLLETSNAPPQVIPETASGDTTILARTRQIVSRPKKPHIVGDRTITDTRPIPRLKEVWLSPEKFSSEDNLKRIFVVGGSAAYGFPYPYQQTYVPLLETMLGDDEFLIINTSRRGKASAELVPVVKTIVDHYDPEAIILFLGNNEWIRWNVMNRTSVNQSLLKIQRLLANSRALALVQYFIIEQGDHRLVGKEFSKDYSQYHELTGASYALQHPAKNELLSPKQWLRTKEKFLDAYSKNLYRMIRYAQNKDVRVILLTIPFNYKLSPAWKHPQLESFDPTHTKKVKEAIRSAASLIDQHDFEQALQQVEQAIRLDPLPPMLHYLKGQCLEELDRPLEAEKSYAQCRENMIGNLGSILSINQRIVEASQETGAELIDLRQIFDNYGHKLFRYFNVDLIHDDCHPTPLGHRLIANTLAPLFQKNNVETKPEPDNIE